VLCFDALLFNCLIGNICLQFSLINLSDEVL